MSRLSPCGRAILFGHRTPMFQQNGCRFTRLEKPRPDLRLKSTVFSTVHLQAHQDSDVEAHEGDSYDEYFGHDDNPD